MKSKKRGFTLIELIVVLSILSLCTAFIYPSLGKGEEKTLSWELEETTNNVIDFINLCKAISRREHNSAVISFKNKSINYVVNGSYREVYNLPGLVNLRWTGNNPVIVNQIGEIQGKGTVILKNTRGQISEITIKVGTGYVSKKK